MECDLDCFEEDQEHIHVRNAGIIDELGHITCFFSLPLTSSHILSDKTGTITKNNLKAVSVCTTTREIPINNEYLSSGAMALDDDAHRLLLNMITNHSALSIATEVADLPPFSSSISLQQSSRPKTMLSLPSSSFSEIRIVSALEEWRSQSRSSYSSAEDMQVFCSSQDERVALSPFFHRVGDSGRRLRFRVLLLQPLANPTHHRRGDSRNPRGNRGAPVVPVHHRAEANDGGRALSRCHLAVL